MLPFNRRLKKVARELRTNMTEAENKLWHRIRRKQLKGYQFYRQKNIGNFIVDFYCPAARLVIEVDGGQHYSESGRIKDRDRDRRLENLGFRVLRVSDREVLKNTDAVLESILMNLPKKSPRPPLEKGGI